jgi:hypothetical protein
MITPNMWKLLSARVRYVEVWSGLLAQVFQYRKHSREYHKAHKDVLKNQAKKEKLEKDLAEKLAASGYLKQQREEAAARGSSSASTSDGEQTPPGTPEATPEKVKPAVRPKMSDFYQDGVLKKDVSSAAAAALLKKGEQTADNKAAAAVFKRRGACFKIVVYAMNVLTYGSNTGLWMALFGTDLNDGLMGICGMTSGVFGMRDTWTKSIA